ncbi:MAG: Dabb family protein [Dehalococcoidia bacterium]|nr:Dabb family protein [Dehalococcoidia bacterium]
MHLVLFDRAPGAAPSAIEAAIEGAQVLLAIAGVQTVLLGRAVPGLSDREMATVIQLDDDDALAAYERDPRHIAYAVNHFLPAVANLEVGDFYRGASPLVGGAGAQAAIVRLERAVRPAGEDLARATTELAALPGVLGVQAGHAVRGGEPFAFGLCVYLSSVGWVAGCLRAPAYQRFAVAGWEGQAAPATTYAGTLSPSAFLHA